jgi:acetyl-CoA carboxylase/biotin carboxylase 1
MKMYMPLIATEDGVPQFVKQPGVTLQPGDILGILTLDDPARVKHAKPFEGLLPPLGYPTVIGNKPHQRLAFCLDVLTNIFDGYDNQAIMASTLKDLVAVLRDPELPFTEVQAVLATLSGRIPMKLEESLRGAMDAVRSKPHGAGSGAGASAGAGGNGSNGNNGGVPEFPASRVKKLLENYVTTHVRPQDRAMFRSQTAALFDIAERYRGGLKQHEIDTLADLLGRYESNERLFGGSIEARVLKLREEHKDNLDKVAAAVLSHMKAASKAKLVFAILEEVKSNAANLANPESKLHKVLQGLASLEAKWVVSLSFLGMGMMISDELLIRN